MAKLGASDVAEKIRRDIAHGLLREHDRLPSSRELATTYGVARNTLRAALQTLEREGRVKTRAGSGTYVVQIEHTATPNGIENASPLALMDARFALEPHICRLCVLHGRPDDFKELEDFCRIMERSGTDANAFSEADSAFHRKLADTTRNEILIWIMGQINSVRSREEWTRMRRLTLTRDIIDDYNQQHRQILEAIRTREPEQAATRMKGHLETARLSLTRAADT